MVKRNEYIDDDNLSELIAKKIQLNKCFIISIIDTIR